jgi:uncharacterized repeat protein (TIGR01451 family)/CSLREA domain-containing protein
MYTTQSRTGMTAIWRLALSIALLAVLALAAPAPQVAHAATINVTTTDDELNADEDCSLREAIEAANTDAVVDACTAGSSDMDTIYLPAGTYTLSLTGSDENANQTGDLDVLDDLTIVGDGADSTIIDADGIDRVLHVVPEDPMLDIIYLDISGVTITGGAVTDTNGLCFDYISPMVGGGGICTGGMATVLTVADSVIAGNVVTSVSSMAGGGGVMATGYVALDDSTVSSNSVTGEYTGMGGGLFTLGSMDVTGSTFSGNQAYNGGGIAPLTMMEELGSSTIVNSTLSGNSAATGGGLSTYTGSYADVTLTNCTVTRNVAFMGGAGLYNGGGTVQLKNTIVADQLLGSDCYGTMTSLQYNIDSDNTCNLTLLGDQPSTDPLLGSLQDNGGPTLTHELLAGSPARDGVADGYCTVSTDQRGAPRPVDGDDNGTPLCDIGSFEADAPLQTVELAIEKSGQPNPVYAGEELVYSLSVTNNGTSTADPVVVVDTLPAEVSYQSDTGGCAVIDTGPPEVLECSIGPLGPSETFIFEITVLVSPDAEPGLIVNSATANDEVTDTTSTLVRAPTVDLVIEKTDTPDPVMAGQELFYEIVVSNAGQATATGVTVTDTLPVDVEYIDNTDNCTGPDLSNRLICSLPDLAGGDSYSFEIKTRVDPDTVVGEPDATLVISNTAQVGSQEIENVPGDNTVTQSTFVEELADLSVLKMSKPDDQVGAGEVFTYTIFVDNVGPSHARNVTLHDVMVSSNTFTILNVIEDPDRSDDCSIDGNAVDCQLEDPLEPQGYEAMSGRWTIQIEVQGDETQDVNNVVDVISDTPDPDMSNNQAQDSIHIGDVADLSLDKSVATPPSPPFHAGTDVCFQLDVTNNGPSTAENVVLEDMLPEGVTVVTIDPSQGSCTTGDPGSTPLTCNLGTLGLDNSATVSVTVNIDPDYVGTLENDAVVSSDIFDPDNGNNRDYVIVDVSTSSDVYMQKLAPPTAMAGEEMTYIIWVENEGPSTLVNFHFDDLLPVDSMSLQPQVTYVGYDMPDGTGYCMLTEHMIGPEAVPMVRCWLDEIPPGDAQAVHLTVRVNPSVPDGTWITNEITFWDADSHISDLYGYYPAETRVINEADLSVWKEAEPWKNYAGEQVMYTIEVANNGPGDAYSVLMTDTLPVGVLAELVTDPACVITGDSPGEEVDCYWDVLSLGETKTFYVFGRVEPDADPGTVSNQVWVHSETTPDPAEYNDYASAPILIQGRADLKVQKFGKPEGEVRAGDELTYTVIVDNLGTGYAHDVTLDDVLESNGSFDLLSVTSDRDALCDPETGTFDQDMFLTCTLSDTLEVKGPEPGSGRWMLTVVVRANEPQDINNVAYVAGSDYDPDLSNNEAMAEHEITAVADLELTTDAWGEMLVGCEGETELWLNEVAAGNNVTYTLTVSNTGPSTAENVTVYDNALPSPDLLEIDVESIEPSQGNCLTTKIVDERTLTCNLGTISPYMTATVTFVAHVPSWVPDATSLHNDAQVFSDMFDDNNGNDFSTHSLLVSRVADLEVVKTQDPEISLPTWDITYTITVTNLGPSDVEGLLISDTIPVPVLDPTWTCCASDDGDCDIPCEPPTCPEEPCPWPDIGLYAQADIPAGEWAIYTVNGTLDWWPCGPFTNTVTLIPPESLTYPPEDIDPCDENNTDIAVNDPMCHYDPLVLKEFPGPDSTP